MATATASVAAAKALAPATSAAPASEAAAQALAPATSAAAGPESFLIVHNVSKKKNFGELFRTAAALLELLERASAEQRQLDLIQE